MAHYHLFQPDDYASASSIISQQHQKMLAKAGSMSRKKRAQLDKLESELNLHFYSPKQTTEQQQVMDKAISIASQKFEEKYNNFTLNNQTYTATHKSLSQKSFLQSGMSIDQMLAQIDSLLATDTWTNEQKATLQNIKAEVNKTNLMPPDSIKSINAMIATVLFGNKTVYGDAFELPLAAFAMLIDNGIETEADNITNYWIANATSATSVNISGLSKADRKKLQFSGRQSLNEGHTELIYANPTKDKVDVKLNFKGVQYNISAKSYSNATHRWIHILGGTSLAVPVMNFGTQQFVSLYLSALYSGHSSLAQIHQAVKATILVFALMGDKGEIADTFVLNDKTKKHIYVRSIADIVNSIITDPMKLNTYAQFQKDSTQIPDQDLQNYANKGGQFSAVEMLNAMHQKKLSVSVYGKAIRDS